MTKKETRTLYVDMTDWAYDVGHAADGSRFYPSVKAIRKHSSCVHECGIGKVDINFLEVVQEPLSYEDWGGVSCSDLEWKSASRIAHYEESIRKHEKITAFLKEQLIKEQALPDKEETD